MTTSRPFILGLSGPSSSGKTTIARLLREIFPSTLIVHEDDFYRPETELPKRAGMLNWDCAAAIDVPALVNALAHVKEHGILPESLISKEDQNTIGDSGVKPETVERLKIDVREWAARIGLSLDRAHENGGKGSARLVIVDGFLLFGESVATLRGVFDARMLLRAKIETAKARREARKGYVTLEGFWEDPEGYVDDIVWPGYVEEHSFLFRNGDVDGDVDESVVRELDIQVCPGGGTWNIEEMLNWVLANLKVSIRQAGIA